MGSRSFTASSVVGVDATLGIKPVVPLYVYPSFAGSDWDDLAADPAGFVIANPNSGPGTEVNSDYTREIDAVRAAGMKVLGYVTTNVGSGPGTRTESLVIADINTWYSLYNVDGVFFDLTPAGSNGDKTAYFQRICDHVHGIAAGQTVVANPGTYPLSAAYVSPADIVCVWEGDYTDNTYLAFAVPGYADAWLGQFEPTKFLHLVYGVDTAAEMRTAAVHAASLGVHWFYAAETTSDWTALASYWSQEVVELGGTHVALDVLDRRNHHGTVLLTAVEGQGTRTAVSNTAYTVLLSDYRVAYTAISAARVVTLPDVAAASGREFVVKDESGSCDGTKTITLTPVSGTIDGASTKVLATAYAVARIYSNGTNWFTY